jgi:hypothetical protein
MPRRSRPASDRTATSIRGVQQLPLQNAEFDIDRSKALVQLRTPMPS